MAYLVVFLGAGIGGAARHGMNLLVMRLVVTQFPLHTLLINVLGSFLMGVVVEVLATRTGTTQMWRLFLTTGILGGFTTFSAFSLEAVVLYERSQLLLAAAYVFSSVVLAIGGLAAGMAIVRAT